jgi:triosephosphate isomerase (TIM)
VGRKPLIAGNWKMNLTHLEAIALMQKFAFALPEKYYDKVEVAVLPPFTHIRSIQTMIDGDGLLMVHGAQDLSPHDAGAYTGDVSGVMLAKLGCRYVVVGHSERREYHDETDEVVNAKVRAAIRNGITPILCVGEGLPVREEGEHLGHCTSQLTGALAKVTAEQAVDLVVAYEPIWAIGTGRNATAEQAAEAIGFIRSLIANRSDAAAGEIRIVYGGSVKPENAADVLAPDGIDGALVGGASLDPDDFAAIVAACR